MKEYTMYHMVERFRPQAYALLKRNVGGVLNFGLPCLSCDAP